MVIEQIDPKALKPYKNNAKIHTDEQVDQIILSIQDFGFNDPIAVDENNMIIEGHGRQLAAIRMGLDQVPCIRLSGLTDEQKKAYIHVHNQLTMNTGFDLEILEQELQSITTVDMGAFGFDLDFSVDFHPEDFDDGETISAHITADPPPTASAVNFGSLATTGCSAGTAPTRQTSICLPGVLKWICASRIHPIMWTMWERLWIP